MKGVLMRVNYDLKTDDGESYEQSTSLAVICFCSGQCEADMTILQVKRRVRLLVQSINSQNTQNSDIECTTFLTTKIWNFICTGPTEKSLRLTLVANDRYLPPNIDSFLTNRY